MTQFQSVSTSFITIVSIRFFMNIKQRLNLSMCYRCSPKQFINHTGIDLTLSVINTISFAYKNKKFSR